VHVKCGIVVERHPVVYPELHKLERDYLGLKDKINKERKELHEKEVQERVAEELKIRFRFHVSDPNLNQSYQIKSAI
jgi:hypothetical protein